VQLQRISSALLYMVGCPEPYYISLSQVEFYYDNITLTLFINIKYSDIAVKNIL